jgi:hypothetical protein
MSNTYTFADVLAMVDSNFPRRFTASKEAMVCNMAQNEIWNMFDWRESLETLPPFYLIPNEQDHGQPFTIVPSDFKGLRKAYLTRLTSSPPFTQEIAVIKDARITQTRYLPSAISYEPDVGAFRLYPRVPDNIGAPEDMIEGTYKKQPTKLTGSVLMTQKPFTDDQYIGMWIEATKWAGWNLLGDERAGGTQVQTNFDVHTGQKAIMIYAIREVAADLGLEDGDPQIAPREGIAGPVGLSGMSVPLVGGYY